MTYFLYCLFAFTSQVLATTCEAWFLKSGVNAGTQKCDLECAIIPVDMGTFDCANQCKTFCKTYIKPGAVDEIASYVETRALTPAEKSLIAKYPVDAAYAYLAKKDALESTRRIFEGNFRNDESDAYRHFMWAGLMREKISAERTLAFLKAHEADVGAPRGEREMDEINNNLGIGTAEKLIKENNINQESLEKAALNGIKAGVLKVITPSGKVPKWKR
jgi:hypothetical protein